VLDPILYKALVIAVPAFLVAAGAALGYAFWDGEKSKNR
jgi:hypothetical protein